MKLSKDNDNTSEVHIESNEHHSLGNGSNNDTSDIPCLLDLKLTHLKPREDLEKRHGNNTITHMSTSRHRNKRTTHLPTPRSSELRHRTCRSERTSHMQTSRSFQLRQRNKRTAAHMQTSSRSSQLRQNPVHRVQEYSELGMALSDQSMTSSNQDQCQMPGATPDNQGRNDTTTVKALCVLTYIVANQNG